MITKSALLPFICLLFSLNADADEIVKFTWDEFGRILVPVDSKEGERRFFQFDTASGRSAILDTHASLYGVKYYAGNIRHLGSGGLFRVRVGSIKQLSIVGMQRQNHIVAVFHIDVT